MQHLIPSNLRVPKLPVRVPPTTIASTAAAKPARSAIRARAVMCVAGRCLSLPWQRSLCGSINQCPIVCQPMHCFSAAAGGPKNNATFFCDGTATTCYLHVANSSNFTLAESYCNRFGGNLVKYDTGAQQVMVETYFSTLTDYWIGLRRTSAAKPFVFTNGVCCGLRPFTAVAASLALAAVQQRAATPTGTHLLLTAPRPPKATR